MRRGNDHIHATRCTAQALGVAEDPHRLIAHWGTLTAEVAPKVAPILLLVRSAAATDAEMATLLADMDAARRKRMSINARHLSDAGHLRPEVTLEHAVDILWTYSSPELYERLVLRRGWPLERYGRFAADAMTAALLPPVRTARHSGRSTSD